jgi:hypothetical protein
MIHLSKDRALFTLDSSVNVISTPQCEPLESLLLVSR